MSKKTKTEDRVFEQPKGDTPLARAMSIPWVAAGIKPETHPDSEGSSYQQSDKLLVWVKGWGGCTGIMARNKGVCKFLVNGFDSDTSPEVTHWAYITEPK